MYAMLKNKNFNPTWSSKDMKEIIRRECLFPLDSNSKILVVLDSILYVPQNVTLDLDILYFGFGKLCVNQKIKTKKLVLADFKQIQINCEMFEGVEEIVVINSDNVNITNMPDLRIIHSHESANIIVDDEVKSQIEIFDITLDSELSINLMDYTRLNKISITVRKYPFEGLYIIYLPIDNTIHEVRMLCSSNIILSNTDNVKFLKLINANGEPNGPVIRMFPNLVSVSFE